MKNITKFTKDFSIVSLLISNIVIIMLAIVENWDVATVLWVYWMQSVIIGLFNFFRILSLKHFSTGNFKINNQPVLPTTQAKLYTAFFFAFHYGFFHFVYAIFLFSLFKSTQTFDFAYLFLGGFIFFVNHFFSFSYNKIKDNELEQNIGRIMLAPYSRIVPMHIIIIFGSLLGQSALIPFLLLKTIVDIFMHSAKHQRLD